MIIDSPGIGESDIMDEIVTQYLPQAFAFIYVINSANAGGVQKDRVRMHNIRQIIFCVKYGRVKMDTCSSDTKVNNNYINIQYL